MLLVCHTALSEAVAHQILLSGFAILQRLDDGWFGQGIYLMTDARYAIDEYGQGFLVLLLVCAVLISNMFPVIELLYESDGFLGKAIVSKADTHVVIVAKDSSADPLPSMPSRWSAVHTYTEIVVRDKSQVVPLGYVMVSKV